MSCAPQQQATLVPFCPCFGTRQRDNARAPVSEFLGCRPHDTHRPPHRRHRPKSCLACAAGRAKALLPSPTERRPLLAPGYLSIHPPEGRRLMNAHDTLRDALLGAIGLQTGLIAEQQLLAAWE